MTRASIDWPRLLGDIAYLIGEPTDENPLVRVPVGTPTLAVFLGLPRGTVRGWLDGQEPKHSVGEDLIRHWCELTGKAEGYAPITVRTPSSSKVRERA